MAKRRRNGPLPGIPILMPVTDVPKTVLRPSVTYPSNSLCGDSYKGISPHPQNTSVTAAP